MTMRPEDRRWLITAAVFASVLGLLILLAALTGPV